MPGRYAWKSISTLPFRCLTAMLMRRPAAWKTYALLLGVLLAGILVRYYVLVHILRPLGPDADDFSFTYIRRIYYPTYSRLDGLAAGVSLALLRTFRPAWWLALRSRGHSLTAGGLALVGATLWCSTQRFHAVYGRAALFDLAGYPVLAVGFALLVASAISDNGLLARVHLPGAALLATLSFSLYLTHKEAVHLLFTWWPGLPEESFWLLPLMLGASLLVAGTLHVDRRATISCVAGPLQAIRNPPCPRTGSSGGSCPLGRKWRVRYRPKQAAPYRRAFPALSGGAGHARRQSLPPSTASCYRSRGVAPDAVSVHR